MADYEQFREERIKANLERMQKLGIMDLSLKLKSLKPTPKRNYSKRIHLGETPLPASGPVRRSSRIQSSGPICYSEIPVGKKEKSEVKHHIIQEYGSRPEIYTEEHDKLLGSCEESWTCFVDGYGSDGKRIYDPVRGKTCHQCRQKTLGHRTHCSECQMVQGQFCGDCLYMRYGENVLEAKKNPEWLCPVCRGICNCSLCRQAKGWPPTGMLYRKISSLGYKSVAHYLVQTRRSEDNSLDDSKLVIPAKKSLPFADLEDTVEKEVNSPVDEELENSTVTLQITMEPFNDPFITESTNDKKDNDHEIKKEDDSICVDNKTLVTPKKGATNSKKKRVFEPATPDSIAGRLRQRGTNGNVADQVVSISAKSIVDDDSIAGRLKRRRSRA